MQSTCRSKYVNYIQVGKLWGNYGVVWLDQQVLLCQTNVYRNSLKFIKIEF